MNEIKKYKTKNIIYTVLIFLGFYFLSSFLGFYVTFGLYKIIVFNRTFGEISGILFASLPYIIYYCIVGLVIPIIFTKHSLRWSIAFSLLTIINTIFTTKTSIINEPSIYDYLRLWINVIVVLPSCILGTVIYLKFISTNKR
jgi:hypothetical protein